MMKLYVVRDVKADCFGAPMSIATEGLARRSFLEACLDQRSELSKYPEDYMLYQVGSYDPNSGSLSVLFPAPLFIVSASAVVAQAKEARLKVEPELPLHSEVASHD